MVDCLIAFGANEGDTDASFRLAVKLLRSSDGIELTAVSEPEQTKPIGGPEDQPPYLNASIRLNTSLSAHAVHDRLVEIEEKLGRERRVRWGSRKIDLDLLLFGDKRVESESLTVPHPRMSVRRFVLEPCLSIAGDMLHPTSGRTIAELLEHLNQRSDIALLVNAPPQLISTLAEHAGLTGWTFMQASDSSQFIPMERHAKLVFVFTGDKEAARLVGEQALAFAGPMLDLRSSTAATEEVVAALKSASVSHE